MLLALAAAATACSESSPSALDPKGPEASNLATLWWILLGLATAMSLLVFGLLGWGLGRGRGPDEQADAPPDQGEAGDRLSAFDRRLVVFGGVVLPAVILVGVGVMTVDAVGDVSQDTGEIAIEVTGEQFWWRVHYEDAGFETANEIHIPTDTRVALTLRAADVIHSFWVPELAGKRDMVPGRLNTLVLEADKPGVYRGQCAEFCGVQHANMAFFVVAHPPEEFRDWLMREASEAAAPSNDLERAGREAFEQQACAGCHTIRGTAADGTLGPDLTHLASRRTLAAGTVENTRGHLAGWMVDAQSTKPGALMPPVTLTPGQSRAILAYLESLR